MTKILVLGNNTEDTDIQATDVAFNRGLVNRGLVTHRDVDVEDGVYHTSLADISSGDLVEVYEQFDEVVLLDQPAHEWTDSKLLLSSYKVMTQIARDGNRTGVTAKYKDNKNIKPLEFFENYMEENRSFCMMPWVAHNDYQGYLSLCSRSQHFKVQDIDKLEDWQTDENYDAVRQKMLKGEMLPESCEVCYQYEAKGMRSYRRHDSMDWIAKLGIENLDDLKNITNPHYYEMRPGNKCNLMCRMCEPENSHLLDREFRQNPELVQAGQKPRDPNLYYTNIDSIDIPSLTDKHLIYLAGGEPTVMRDVYTFLQKCIDAGRTDFGLTMGTNAQVLSDRFMDLINQFTQVNFSVSIDAYGLPNDYIRWRSDFETIMANAKRLKSLGHNISFNHVPTIWAVHRTHELFEYIDANFDIETLYLQYNRYDLHSAFRSPLPKEVIASMERCQKTRLYWSDGKDCRSGIDSILEHYKYGYEVDLEHLKKFFDWNDMMDKVRKIKMKDYIPELDECRELLNGNE